MQNVCGACRRSGFAPNEFDASARHMGKKSFRFGNQSFTARSARGEEVERLLLAKRVHWRFASRMFGSRNGEKERNAPSQDAKRKKKSWEIEEASPRSECARRGKTEEEARERFIQRNSSALQSFPVRRTAEKNQRMQRSQKANGIQAFGETIPPVPSRKRRQ